MTWMDLRVTPRKIDQSPARRLLGDRAECTVLAQTEETVINMELHRK